MGAHVRIASAATALVAALLLLPTARAGSPAHPFQVTRTFRLGPGRVERTFTFRERSGVILLNRLTVPAAVRAFVEARIPHVAGARVSTPSPACRQRSTTQVCTQGEEWCPMPQATWHFHLVKLGGPAGAIRFDYVVAPPP